MADKSAKLEFLANFNLFTEEDIVLKKENKPLYNLRNRRINYEDLQNGKVTSRKSLPAKSEKKPKVARNRSLNLKISKRNNEPKPSTSGYKFIKNTVADDKKSEVKSAQLTTENAQSNVQLIVHNTVNEEQSNKELFQIEHDQKLKIEVSLKCVLVNVRNNKVQIIKAVKCEAIKKDVEQNTNTAKVDAVLEETKKRKRSVCCDTVPLNRSHLHRNKRKRFDSFTHTEQIEPLDLSIRKESKQNESDRSSLKEHIKVEPSILQSEAYESTEDTKTEQILDLSINKQPQENEDYLKILISDDFVDFLKEYRVIFKTERKIDCAIISQYNRKLVNYFSSEKSMDKYQNPELKKCARVYKKCVRRLPSASNEESDSGRGSIDSEPFQRANYGELALDASYSLFFQIPVLNQVYKRYEAVYITMFKSKLEVKYHPNMKREYKVTDDSTTADKRKRAAENAKRLRDIKKQKLADNRSMIDFLINVIPEVKCEMAAGKW